MTIMKFNSLTEGAAFTFASNLVMFPVSLNSSYPNINNLPAFINSLSPATLETFISKSFIDGVYALTLSSCTSPTEANIKANMATLESMLYSIDSTPEYKIQVVSMGTNYRVTFTANPNFNMYWDYGSITNPDSYFALVKNYPMPFSYIIQYNALDGTPTPSSQTLANLNNEGDIMDIGPYLTSVTSPSSTSTFRGWFYNNQLVSSNGQNFSGVIVNPFNDFSENNGNATLIFVALYGGEIAKGGYILYPINVTN